MKARKDLVKKAYEFAKLAHEGDKRESGEPYFIHPMAVAKILKEWRLDEKTIVAGLLHDVVEHGAATNKDLVKEFGQEIAFLVEGVTNVAAVKLRSSQKKVFVENLRKMFVAMAADLRVVLLRLADRLHNARTLEYLPKPRGKRFARELLEIYAPLAGRLGMGEVKGEMEDLAFPFVYPKEYEWIKEYSKPYYKQADEHIKAAIKTINGELEKEGLDDFQVHGRAKHWYSLWKKLLRPEIGKEISKIYDLVALRIIVNSVEDCYLALGAVHKLWRPAARLGVSDFIAQPKPNGYQSIHTRVFGVGERMMEVQIRTLKMHEEAEFGLAAHWYYGSLKFQGARDEKLEKGVMIPEKLKWVRQLAEWQKTIKDSQELEKALKIDVLKKRIFVFTPKGDVFDLPEGATPVDFAFAVHTDLGKHIQGAKINGKMASLNSGLRSGDVCEIIKRKKAVKPSRDWLGFVKTTTARRQIQKAYL